MRRHGRRLFLTGELNLISDHGFHYRQKLIMLKQLLLLCLVAIVSVQACSDKDPCPAESLCTHAYNDKGGT
jgi:hypothetical protein